ncbi:hypothetical protein [Xanthomonas arboricola]|uniref:Uncharacterized protein n=1 Tax=Xanthomonas arboricola TaxID=56448 RepID=A0AB73H4C5_9XANT|nr:hypothetical protein [Xanthomonas arboricola]MBB5672294.1 hypothetical protein [Xanthomonas arboricola]
MDALDALESYVEARAVSLTSLELDAPDADLARRIAAAARELGIEEQMLEAVQHLSPAAAGAPDLDQAINLAAGEAGSIRLVEEVHEVLSMSGPRP